MKFIQSYSDIDRFPSKDRRPVQEEVLYHFIWFGAPLDHHVLSLASLFETQHNPRAILWTNEASRPGLEACLMPIFSKKAFEIRVYKSKLEGILFPVMSHDNFWTADDWRVEILYEHGGMYVDIDFMFLRDMSWLTRYRCSYRWASEGYFNPALLVFPKGDRFLLTTLIRFAELPDRKKWGRFNTLFNFDNIDKMDRDIYCLPCLWLDPTWVAEGEFGVEKFDRFFEPFDGDIEKLFPLSLAYHWHNRWKKDVRDPATCVGKFYKKFVIDAGYRIRNQTT
jgi:hypothetical protein